jgi:hypothetical protein
MPVDHMNRADPVDPFMTPADARGGADDPERITAGRYRLPDLIPNPYSVGPMFMTGTESRKGGWQRVTTLVKAIGDARALDLWHQRLLIMGLVKRPDLYDLACATVASADQNDPKALRAPLEELAGKILAAAGADEGANLGTAFHGFTEAQDLGLMHYARRIWHGKLANYANGLEAQGLEVIPEYVERKIVVLKYGLAGTLDRILWDRINRRHVISDTKSQKKFWTWLEIAAQESAYAMADAMWDRVTCSYVEMPKVDQDEGIVAWMPVNGYDPLDTSRGNTSTEDVDGVDFFSVDLAKGRRALQLCSEVDALRSEAKSVKQTWGLLRPAPGLALVEAYARRLGGVSSLAEGSALWAEIVKAGVHESAELIELARETVERVRTASS